MNRTKNFDFTIVVPIYNEEDNIDRLERRLAAYIAKCPRKACVLFVNDGSCDDSLRRIKDTCKRNEAFYYISFARNAGLSTAIKAGIDYTESPLMGYIDADLQTSPEDFDLLLPHTEKYALVTGIRTNRKDSWWKRRQSRIANGFRRMMTGDTAIDTGCPLKILHTDVAKRIPFFKGLHRFIPAMVALQKKEYMQVPVSHHQRVAGVSKFSMANRFWGPLRDCFAYRWMRNRYIIYYINEAGV